MKSFAGPMMYISSKILSFSSLIYQISHDYTRNETEIDKTVPSIGYFGRNYGERMSYQLGNGLYCCYENV